jgi:formylglycine-generating enzyme required for sulfatase activity
MKPDLILVPAGSFLMGDESGNDDEKPVHRVSLNSFLIGKFTVTVSEFRKFLHSTSHDFPAHVLNNFTEQHPVTHVSWIDAIEYSKWLSKSTGESFRLPTEAEWEYAARSGASENTYPWGKEDWISLTSLHTRFQKGPEPVGSMLDANAFGIFDMGMNVHEWCKDWYDPDYYQVSPEDNPAGPSSGRRRSSRGGSWRHQIKITRCAARSSIPPDYRYADYGFRIVREVD